MPSNHLILCRPLLLSSSCLQSFPASGAFGTSIYRWGDQGQGTSGDLVKVPLEGSALRPKTTSFGSQSLSCFCYPALPGGSVPFHPYQMESRRPLCLQTSVCSRENCSAVLHLHCLLENPTGGMVLMEVQVGGVSREQVTGPVVPSVTVWCIQPWSGVHGSPGSSGGAWQRTSHPQNRLLPSVFQHFSSLVELQAVGAENSHLYPVPGTQEKPYKCCREDPVGKGESSGGIALKQEGRWLCARICLLRLHACRNLEQRLGPAEGKAGLHCAEMPSCSSE